MLIPMESRTVRGALHLLTFAGSIAVASVGAAAAQQAYPAQPRQYYGLYQESQGGGFASSRQDRADFDRSGTRGRMGLGASPYHPEGPGNPNY